ncbi:flagellar hook-length control protein FliK [Bremerella sp. JC770]|uniref:flagellar hook-length control protein FliK n=1 Tax=Bremerella sp. JC770 TaxID=3232137 RepID=UPI0034583D81
MESSSSNSVNPASGWSGGSRSNSAPAADPMAFFDLIMKSSQAMAGQSGKSFDPVASTGTQTSDSDPYTAVTDDPNLHDGYDDSSTSYASDVQSRESSETDRPVDAASVTEDVAATTEFSEQTGAGQDSDDEPDQAALETAAAATQQEQLLGAPDTLAEAEQAESEQQAPTEIARTADEKQDAALTGELKTDQPLDTAKPSEDTSDKQQDPSGELAAESAQRKTKPSDDPSLEASEEEPLVEGVEASAVEESTGVRRDNEGKLKLESVEQITEETTEVDVNLETGDTAQDDTSERKQRSASSQRADNPKAKPVDVVEPAASAPVDPSTVAAVTKASEALAAAASGSAASATPTASSSTPNGTAGVNNLASLLQRGFQRGSLQKAESSQTPQLDPKQQIRLINRVARAVESTPPGQSIKIRLNPSELGQLKVEIKIENGNMTAKIEAENAATRQVLLENLPQLRERLAEANINVQQFEVELMGQQTPQDGSASTFADQSDEQGGSQAGTRHGTEAIGEEETTASQRETVNKEAERDSRNLNITV